MIRQFITYIPTLILLVIVLASCTKEPLDMQETVFYVKQVEVTPHPDNDQRPVFTIEFSEAIDKSTFIPDETFYFFIDEGYFLDGNLEWVDDKTIAYTITNHLPSICAQQDICAISYTLVGTDVGTGCLKAADGDALDGNNDWIPGGNYNHSHEMLRQ